MKNVFFLVLIVAATIGIQGCRNGKNIKVVIDIPLDSLAEVTIVNYVTGAEVVMDTMKDGRLVFETDSLSPGAYHIICSWNRLVVQPAEIKRLQRYDASSNAKYFLLKEMWIPTAGIRQFTLTVDSSIQNQTALEETLLGTEYSAPLRLETSNDESRIFDDFLHIEYDHWVYNQEEKGRFRDEMYHALDDGDMERYTKLSNQVAPLWLADVETKLKSAEVDFLLQHPAHPMLPYILVTRVSSPEDFLLYRPVFESLPATVQDRIQPRLAKHMP